MATTRDRLTQRDAGCAKRDIIFKDDTVLIGLRTRSGYWAGQFDRSGAVAFEGVRRDSFEKLHNSAGIQHHTAQRLVATKRLIKRGITGAGEGEAPLCTDAVAVYGLCKVERAIGELDVDIICQCDGGGHLRIYLGRFRRWAVPI